MNDNSCDSENEMQVEECSGGRKSKSKIKKGVGQSKKGTIISNKVPRVMGWKFCPLVQKLKGRNNVWHLNSAMKISHSFIIM